MKRIDILHEEQANRNTPPLQVKIHRLFTSRWMRGATSLIIAALCLWFAGRIIDYRDVLHAFQISEPMYIVLALLCYIISYLMRANRIQQLFPHKKLSATGLWRITATHNLLNYILPMRSGDLSLIYLLKRHFSISIGIGAGVWILVRLLDMFFSMFFLSVSIAIYVYRGGWQNHQFIFYIILVISILLLVGILALPMFWSLIEWVFALLRNRHPVFRRPTSEKFYHKVIEIGEVLQSSHSRRSLRGLTLTSAAIWICLFGFFWAILQATHLHHFSIPEIVIGSSGAIIVNFLPINSFASIGTLEAGWTAGFSLVGMSPSDALTSGVVTHIWVLIFAVGLALLSIVTDTLLTAKNTSV